MSDNPQDISPSLGGPENQPRPQNDPALSRAHLLRAATINLGNPDPYIQEEALQTVINLQATHSENDPDELARIVVLGNLLTHQNPVIRNRAIQTLGETTHPTALKLLNQHLNDSDFGVRYQVLCALSNSDRGLEIIVDTLSPETFIPHRFDITTALIILMEHRVLTAIPTIADHAIRGDLAEIRSTATNCLGLIGSEDTIPYRLVALYDEDEETRNLAFTPSDTIEIDLPDPRDSRSRLNERIMNQE